MQYCFDGPEKDVMAKPHGNSKTSKPFFTTSNKTKKRIASLATNDTPKNVVHKITNEEGGEIQARGTAFLPRDRQQVANFRRGVTRPKDSDVLYSIMLECKLAQGQGEAFVRDVKAAPEPQSVLFCDWQIDDLLRFCTDSREFSILQVDTTFNLGDFFVTPMSYHHLMLEDIHTRKNPILIGPILVHQSTQFSSFNYFASTLIGHNKRIRNVLAFATDGDKSLVEALAHNFPFALQLRCFLHFKKNIQAKLSELGLPKHITQQFLDDIFGKRERNVQIEGLVDATSSEDFDSKLDLLEEVWNTRESPYAGQIGPQFYVSFKRIQANTIRYHMRKDIREAAGLGSPPAICTTNGSEAINSVLKKQVKYQRTQWPAFVQEMKSLVDAQQEEIIRSLSGRGRYRLTESNRNLGVTVLEWNKMRPDQRKQVVEKFRSAQLNRSQRLANDTRPGPSNLLLDDTPPGPSSLLLDDTPPGPSSLHLDDTQPGSSSLHLDDTRPGPSSLLLDDTQPGPSSLLSDDTGPGALGLSGLINNDQQDTVTTSATGLSISAENSRIHTIPLITLQGIWTKAASLLQDNSAITHTPGSDKRARAVLSHRSENPHIVRPKSDGQFVCDSNCPQWSSSKICSHTVAVAEKNNCLQNFINWYIRSAPQVNITNLAMAGMPSGRGKKKNQVQRKRSKSQRAPPDTIIGSPPSLLARPTLQTPQIQQPSVFRRATSPPQMIYFGSPAYTPYRPQAQCTPQPPYPQTNTNPFYLKFIGGNIRTCQGCRNSLRQADGTISLPPYDLTIARAERRPYRDHSGNLITPQKESNAHYHCRVACVTAAEPSFIPRSLHVPTDIYHQLGPIHREYLNGEFGLGV